MLKKILIKNEMKLAFKNFLQIITKCFFILKKLHVNWSVRTSEMGINRVVAKAMSKTLQKFPCFYRLGRTIMFYYTIDLQTLSFPLRPPPSL